MKKINLYWAVLVKFLLSENAVSFQVAELGVLLEEPVGRIEIVLKKVTMYIKAFHGHFHPPIKIQQQVLSEPRDKLTVLSQVSALLSKNLTGFISYTTCKIVPYLKSAMSMFPPLPYIAVVSGRCPDRIIAPRSHGLVMRERERYMFQALIDIIKKQGWTEVDILFDNDFGVSQLDLLLSNLSLVCVKSVIHRVLWKDERSAETVLGKLKMWSRKRFSEKIFVLLLRDEVGRMMLHMASSFGFFKNKNIFFVVVIHDVRMKEVLHKDLSIKTTNVIVLGKVWNSPSKRGCHGDKLDLLPNITLDEACVTEALLIFAEAVSTLWKQERKTFSDPLCQQQSNSDWPWSQRLSQLLIKSNKSGMFVPTKFDADGFSSNTEYEISRLVQQSIQVVATWNRDDGLVVKDALFPGQKIGFGNTTFIVGIHLVEPYAIEKKVGNTTIFEGFCVDILRELSRKLNFRYKLLSSPEKTSGSVQPDGSWNGLVGMTIRKEVDFAVGPFTLTPEREEVIDFSMPFAEEDRSILIKRPSKESDGMFRVFQPFHGSVWAILGVTVSLVGVALTIINQLYPFGKKKVNSGHQMDNTQLNENMWLVFTYYMQQGTESEPKSSPGRLLVGFWWIFTILMATSYTANLAALLTISIEVLPIDNLEDLLAQTQVKAFTLHGSSTYSTFQNSKSGTYKGIWDMMKTAPIIKTAQEVEVAVSSSNYAFIGMSSQINHMVAQHCENLAIAGKPFHMARIGFILQQGSDIVKDISSHIMKMQESGLIDKWRKNWWAKKNRCSVKGPKAGAEGLGVNSLAGPMVLFMGAAILGILYLFIECAVKKFQDQQRNM